MDTNSSTFKMPNVPISIPKNLYTGNAGIFSSTPYINFAINQLAQKQAKNEAIDKYYADQFSKVNGQGLAPEEQQALLGTKNNLLEYYNANKKAIHNGDIAATTGVNQYLSKMQDIIGEGKYKTAQAKDTWKIKSNPNSASLLTDEAAKEMHVAQAPIFKQNSKGEWERNDYDPVTNPNGYKPFDFNKEMFNQKPYTSTEMQNMSNAYNSKLKPANVTYKPILLPDGSLSKTQLQATATFTPDQITKAIQDKENIARQDPRLQVTIDKGHPFSELKAEHENDFNLLNDFHKKYTGKDITDYAGLYSSIEGMKLLAPQVVPHPITNEDAKMSQAQRNALNKMYTQNGLVKGRMQFAHDLKNSEKDTQTQDAWEGLHAKSKELLDAQKNNYQPDVNGNVKTPILVNNGEEIQSGVNAGKKLAMYGIPFNAIDNSASQTAVLKVLKNLNINSDGSDIFLVPNKDASAVTVMNNSTGMPITTISKQQIQLAANSNAKTSQKVLGTVPDSKTATDTKASAQGTAIIEINGTRYKVPKSSFSKMDKDGVKYKVIKK